MCGGVCRSISGTRPIDDHRWAEPILLAIYRSPSPLLQGVADHPAARIHDFVRSGGLFGRLLGRLLGGGLANLGRERRALVGLAAAGRGASADLRAILGTDELDQAELAAIADSGLAQLHNAGVATGPILKPGGDVLEDVAHELG